MVSVTSASHYIMSVSHYHLPYQSRSSMYICGLIPLNFAKLAEAVPIADTSAWPFKCGFCEYVISTKISWADPCLLPSDKNVYCKTCLKRPLKNKIKIWFPRPIITKCRSKVLQNAPREHSAILSTFITLPFVFKTFVLSIFKWLLKTVFTVFIAAVSSRGSEKHVQMRSLARLGFSHIQSMGERKAQTKN